MNSGKNEEKARDRVLSAAELKLIWNNLYSDQFAAITKLLMLTGQRANEIAGLCWSELGDGQITLPAERTKNKRPHRLPLPPAAVELIAQQTARAGRDLVFGAGDGPFSGWSRCKERLDERVAKANGGKPLPDWTIHDLRRSAATHMAEIGVLPHIVESILNHVSGHKAASPGPTIAPPIKRTCAMPWSDGPIGSWRPSKAAPAT